MLNSPFKLPIPTDYVHLSPEAWRVDHPGAEVVMYAVLGINVASQWQWAPLEVAYYPKNPADRQWEATVLWDYNYGPSGEIITADGLSREEAVIAAAKAMRQELHEWVREAQAGREGGQMLWMG